MDIDILYPLCTILGLQRIPQVIRLKKFERRSFHSLHYGNSETDAEKTT